MEETSSEAIGHPESLATREAPFEFVGDATRDLSSLPLDLTLATVLGDAANYATMGFNGGNLAASFLGSWDGWYRVKYINWSNKTATIQFHIQNTSTWDSATRIPHTDWSFNGNGLPALGISPSNAKQFQVIEWTESLGFSAATPIKPSQRHIAPMSSR